MVMCPIYDHFNGFKIPAIMTFVNMARKFGVMIERHDSLFELRNPYLYVHECHHRVVILGKTLKFTLDVSLHPGV